MNGRVARLEPMKEGSKCTFPFHIITPVRYKTEDSVILLYHDHRAMA